MEEIQANTSLQSLSITEALQMMVHREISDRANRRQARLIKDAKLRYKNTSIETIDFQAKCTFNHEQYRSLFDMSWLSRYRNILFTGPTGINVLEREQHSTHFQKCYQNFIAGLLSIMAATIPESNIATLTNTSLAWMLEEVVIKSYRYRE